MQRRAKQSAKDSTGPSADRATRALARTLAQARACRLCEAHLPLGPRPVLRASTTARLLIVGQAPGRRVHETGLPWNDPSGDLLRTWLELDRDRFYDERQIAIVPVGLCYPGTGKGGDLPPRPECAPLWHPRVRARLPRIELILAIGAYAHAHYLPEHRGRSLTETVQRFRECPPTIFPLPHPSPRNRRWLRDRPWFEREVIPALRARVRTLFADSRDAP